MAETNVATGAEPTSTSTEPTKKSPVRTLILFGVLLLLIAAYAHDYFIAKPAAMAADQKIHEFVAARNAQGVKEGSLVNSADIQEALGKKPSKVTEEKDYAVEIYRYWGGMLPQRQYISVLYLGPKDKRRYHVHYLNTMPEPEDYPTDTKIPDAPADNADDKSAPPGDAQTESEAPASEEANPPAAPSETEPAEETPAEEKTEADSQ
jgi:hypothetical protein